jgi:hypothetical protein
LKEEPKKENPDAGQKKEETEGEGKSKGWGAITGAS